MKKNKCAICETRTNLSWGNTPLCANHKWERVNGKVFLVEIKPCTPSEMKRLLNDQDHSLLVQKRTGRMAIVNHFDVARAMNTKPKVTDCIIMAQEPVYEELINSIYKDEKTVV